MTAFHDWLYDLRESPVFRPATPADRVELYGTIHHLWRDILAERRARRSLEPVDESPPVFFHVP